MSLSRPFFSQRITQQRGHELAVRLKMGISRKPVATSALTLALAETGSVPCQTRNEGGGARQLILEPSLFLFQEAHDHRNTCIEEQQDDPQTRDRRTRRQ